MLLLHLFLSLREMSEKNLLFTDFWTVLECADGDDHRAEGKDPCCMLQS